MDTLPKQNTGEEDRFLNGVQIVRLSALNDSPGRRERETVPFDVCGPMIGEFFVTEVRKRARKGKLSYTFTDTQAEPGFFHQTENRDSDMQALYRCRMRHGGQGHNLRVAPNGMVDLHGGLGEWARFEIQPNVDINGKLILSDPTDDNSGQYYLVSVGHTLKNEVPTYLNFRRSIYDSWTSRKTSAIKAGCLELVTERSRSSLFHIRVLYAQRPDGPFGILASQRSLIRNCFSACKQPDYCLTHEEKVSFVKDGFLICRSAVSPDLIDNALRVINRGLSDEASFYIPNNKNKTAILRAYKDKEIINKLLVNDSVMTKLRDIMEDLAIMSHDEVQTETAMTDVGINNTDGPEYLSEVGHQVALRYPADEETIANPPDLQELYKRRWHVDGVDQGKLTSFSLLVGVALSDQEVSGCGNLFVLPGSHHVIAPILEDIGAYVGKGGNNCANLWKNRKPNLEHIDPVPVLLKKGDMVVLHLRTAHSIGINLSPHIRYQCYFRLNHERLTTNRNEEVLKDMYYGFNEDIRQIARELH